MRKCMLLALIVMLLPACQAWRPREFPSSRAGAEAAIAVALKQPTKSAMEFTVKKEAAPRPSAAWKRGVEVLPGEKINAVVLLRFDSAGHATGESINLPGNRASLDEAQLALNRAQSLDRLIARVDGPGIYGDTFAWGWIAGSPASVAVFDDGVCIGDDCAAYSDIRSVFATDTERQSAPYPATREGMLAARADPIAQNNVLGRVAVEIPRPTARVWREVYLYNVSQLEDERVCGQAMEYPLAIIERCYAYAQMEGLVVKDRTTNLADALVDTATFPFRLVGAAAVATAMGAH